MKRQVKKKSATAARILEAADKLFCERGYDGVSMRDVAQSAKANKALVFYYFSSKADLFERVLERYYRAHIRALTEGYEGEGTLRERLHRMIDAYLDFIAEHRRYPMLVQQLVAGQNVPHELIERNLAPLFRWTEQVLSEVTPEQGPLAARHFYVTFSGMVINYFTYAPVLASMWDRDPESEEALAERREHVRWMVDTLLDRLTSES